MKRVEKTYIQYDKCPKCGARAVTTWCPPGISTQCPNCGYGIASSLFHPIDLDDKEYSVVLSGNQEASKENLSALSQITGKNFIECKKLLTEGGLLFCDCASKVNEHIDFLIEHGISISIVPEWPYFEDPIESDSTWTTL